MTVGAPGCKHADATLRSVTLHVSCTPAPDAGGIVLFEGLGDFERSAATVGGYPVAAVGDGLPAISPAARALYADAIEGGQSWWGLAAIPGSGPVDAWLQPALTSCAAFVAPGADATPPAQRSGAAMAAIDPEHALVVGGAPGEALPTLVVDLATGGVAWASPDLREPRLGATVTPFGAGALVAGGEDPRAAGAPFSDAEVYDVAAAGFDQQTSIRLSEARAMHGAVVLASGATLLVGGIGAANTVLSTMELVDPNTRAVRAEGVALLAVARSSPAVLRLASGEILVAGGVDSQGTPVSTLEWFSPDVSSASRPPFDLPAGAAASFAALEAGGALAVVAPPAGAASATANVWVIDADGGVEAAAGVEGSLTTPVLFGGAGDAPVLWTGDRWLRWQPWQGVFGALDILDTAPAHVGGATASPDPGLAMWLDGLTGAVTVLRFDTRGTYSPLEGALLVNDPTDTAPDRLATDGALIFEPALGLTLAAGASAFVTDRTYADVVVDLGAPTAQPPLVVVRDEAGSEIVVGGDGCGDAALAGTTNVHVERHGTQLTWRVASGASGGCQSLLDASARVTIGVRGTSPGPSVAESLEVTRLGSP